MTKAKSKHPQDAKADQAKRELDQKKQQEEREAEARIKKERDESFLKEDTVIKTIEQGDYKIELLKPEFAWTEIKCYEMNEDFTLQPIRHPIRVEVGASTERRTFEKMGILILCEDRNGKREIICPPPSGFYSDFTFKINVTFKEKKYQISSEPDKLKSLPSPNLPERFFSDEGIDGKEVWKQFKRYRETYLDVGDDKRKYIIQTAWDLGTHFHMVFNAYPYQNFYGFRGSGKNRAHEISKELCFHAKMIATAKSISSVFRAIDALGATWLKNEAEILLGRNKNEELLELCLEGYKTGSSITLTSDDGKNKKRSTLDFDVYSPKSFASDKNLSGALGSRMIRYVMQRTGEKQGNIELDKEWAKKIRDDAYLLRLQDGWRIAELAKTPVEEILEGHDLKLVSRDREIFFPLLIITKEYGNKKEFEDIISFIRDYLEQQRQESIDQPISIVLNAAYFLCLEKRRKSENNESEFWIGIQDIQRYIIESDPEAWRLNTSYGHEEKEIIRTSETAKFYTARKIGSFLSELGFENKRRENGGFHRRLSIPVIERKAKILNIPLEIEKQANENTNQGALF